ncbi:MAG: hypothetical protein AAF399_19935 [Bacteroidota bacterium]
MDRIRDIYQSFSKSEVRYLKNYLIAFHTKGENKSLALIELLEKHPKVTQAEAAEKLYGNAKSKAFLMLKSRLLDKMLETLSLSINLQNNPTIKADPAAFASIQLYKDMTAAWLLRRRGMGKLAGELLKSCLKEADAADLPEFSLLALVQLRNLSRSESEVVNDLTPAIQESQAQFATDLMGIEVFDLFRVKSANQSVLKDESIAFFEERLKELENRLDEAYSVRAHYYYLALKVQLNEGNDGYEAGKAALLELIELVESTPSLQAKNRLGTPYLRLAGIEMLGGNYQAAMRASGKALDLLQKKKNNYLSALLYRIFACMYCGEMALAEVAWESAQWFIERGKGGTSLDILHYLRSSMLYIQGDFKGAIFALGDVKNLFSDKSGWNSALRIHEIQLLIDRDHLDTTMSRIETLRKHLTRYKGEARQDLMYKFLTHLERQSFDFSALTPEMEHLLQQLEAPESWSSVSPEVIRFDVWARAKATDRGFYPLLLETLGTM